MSSNLIKVRVKSPELYVPDSFRKVWVSKADGIQAVMGKTDTGREIQTLLFDKSKWNRKKLDAYLQNRKPSRAEDLGHRKTRLAAHTVLYSNKPDWSNKEVELKSLSDADVKNLSNAELASKYFFYTEFVHEGTNLNGDHFFKDELLANYQSASFNPIDWEHIRSELIGTSLDARIVDNGVDPIAVGFNGVLFRLADAMMVDNRDEIIRQRFFEGKLFTSMEVLFDAFQCVHCEFSSSDFIEFDFHVMSNHPVQVEEAGMIERGLKGIDFVGAGIVEHPGDPQAEVYSLRTSDEGILEAIASKDDINQPDLEINAKKIVISTKNKPNNKPNNDKDNEPNVVLSSKNIQGGTRMFKLADKVSKATSLNDMFAKAQQVLKDFMGDNPLTDEQAEAFASELTELVKSRISEADFKVDAIYNTTDEEKLSAVTAARDEEKSVAEAKLNEIQAKLDSKDAEIEGLKTKVADLETQNAELKEAEAKKEKEAKADSFIKGLAEAGVALTESMAKRVKDLALAALDGDNSEDELKTLHADFIATAKQTTLDEASRIMGDNAAGGSDDNAGDLASKLKAARVEYAKGDK